MESRLYNSCKKVIDKGKFLEFTQKLWDWANISQEVYLRLSRKEKPTMITKYYVDMKNKFDGKLGSLFLFCFFVSLGIKQVND